MCGVVGIAGQKSASHQAFLALTTLQHRGQDAAGILTHDRDGFHRVRNIGLIESVFNRTNMSELTGEFAIAHARYSTSGRGAVNEVQPFLVSYPYGIGLVHNGNLINADALRIKLKSEYRRQALTHSDSELLINLLAEGFSHGTEEKLTLESVKKAVGFVSQHAKGSYSVIAEIADQGLIAFRDPNGIRPLILGKKENAYMVASESVAMEFAGFTPIRDIEPGEVIFIDQSLKLQSTSFLINEKPESHPCMFEWVYFASPESVVDHIGVYRSRLELGRKLAEHVREELKKRDIKIDIVVPVPETARIAAISLAEELGLPYRELLIKNRYIKRTFILETQDKRETAVNLKLSPVKAELKGKNVILVDDSIVRGTTSRKLIELVKEAGAAKVVFVSTCPPIKHPCFYGIDFPSYEELIASGRSVSEVEKNLGADAVIYQTEESLVAALSDSRAKDSRLSAKFDPCMACLTGKYLVKPDAQKTGEMNG